MAITGRTPNECFKEFAEHMRKLATATVSKNALLALVENEGERAGLRFREHGSAILAELNTKYGKLYFSLAQELEAVQETKKQYRLSTRRYWYRLQSTPALDAQALIRWEYEISSDRGPAPHHVQADAKAGPLDLNHLHVPSGRVMIEDVIRFLIVDLEHKPPCGEDWPDVLEKSARDYFEKFASHKFRRPDRS